MGHDIKNEIKLYIHGELRTAVVNMQFVQTNKNGKTYKEIHTVIDLINRILAVKEISKLRNLNKQLSATVDSILLQDTNLQNLEVNHCLRRIKSGRLTELLEWAME